MKIEICEGSVPRFTPYIPTNTHATSDSSHEADACRVYLWKREAEDAAQAPPRVQRRAYESESIRQLLHHLLPEGCELAHTPHGRPYIIRYAAGEAPEISISHTRNLFAVALQPPCADETPFTIGLDIETIQPRVLRLAPRFCTETELQHIHYYNKECDRQRLATAYWTLKEAAFKALRENKGLTMSDISATPLNEEGAYEIFYPTLGLQAQGRVQAYGDLLLALVGKSAPQAFHPASYNA